MRHARHPGRPQSRDRENPPARRLGRLRAALPARTVAAALALAALSLGIGLGQGGEVGGSFAAVHVQAPLGPEGVPIPQAKAIAGPGSPRQGSKAGGIPCGAIEQLAFHVHAHLTLFVAGAAKRVPAGIGIGAPRNIETTPRGDFVGGGTCFSWLHTHAADGIIHIESPVQRSFTLGEFFAVWGQPLGPNRVGPATGTVTAYVGGKRYRGNPRSIPLGAHSQIQLDVGRPLVAPTIIRFPQGL
jgi:hypothetical protein